MNTPVAPGTGDLTPPTAPSNLSATAPSPTQVNLSWTAATDNVAVTGYRVERCQGAGCSVFVEVAQPPGTTFSDGGRIASTSYSYRVRAIDAAGNLGPYSGTATATTPAPTDSTPPTAPSNLTATATSPTQVNLSWTAATDNVAVTGYRVERCQGAGCSVFTEIAQPPGTTFSDAGKRLDELLLSRARHRRRGQPRPLLGDRDSDDAGPDRLPAPDGTVQLECDRDEPDAGQPLLDGRDRQRRGHRLPGGALPGCRLLGLHGGRPAAGDDVLGWGQNRLDELLLSRACHRRRGQPRPLLGDRDSDDAGPDRLPPPTAPSNLSATATSPTQVNLSWTAATDNVAVTGYRVERCQGAGCSVFTEIAQPPGTTFSDGGRTASTSYSYRVRAIDAAGNLGPYSGTATATTPAPTSGLAAAYAFNAGSGTSAADASGSGLTGTLTNGATWGTGRNAGAVSLDGVNDFVELGNPTLLQLTGSMTVSAWVNSAVFPHDDAAIVSKRANSKVGWQLDTTVDRGPRTIGFKLTNSSGGDMFRYGASTLLANTWYHVTGVYNAASSQLHVYLNGQLDDGTLLGTVTSTQRNSSVNVNIGRRPGSSSNNFNGRLDDVRIYNRALTQTEIQADMNAPVG